MLRRTNNKWRVSSLRGRGGNLNSFLSLSLYLSLSLCIYIYIYIYLYTHVFMLYVMHLSLYICMYLYIYIYICIHTCMYVCMYACMHVCMNLCMYVCMYNIYIYIYFSSPLVPCSLFFLVFSWGDGRWAGVLALSPQQVTPALPQSWHDLGRRGEIYMNWDGTTSCDL